MKKKAIIILLTLVSPFTYPRGGGLDTEAEYIVPTAPEFIAFSRFKVGIVDRFRGPETTKISYIFPEFLVGEVDRVISFTRIPNTENSWTSPDLDAHCAVIGDEFTCNIYGRGATQSTKVLTTCGPTVALKAINTEGISRTKSLMHLNEMNLSEQQFNGFSGVINSFFCQEPRGFLSYDID